MKTIKKIILILLSITGGTILLCFAYLFSVSGNKAIPVLTEDGSPIENSIYKIEKWKIGNIEQKMIIYGQNLENPVVLFLHGGPGLTEFPYVNKVHKEIEKHATIVYWQQRGSSLSPVEEATTESLNTKLFVEDIIEITERLKKKFNKKQIFLVAHSWGTLIGMLAVDKRPDLFKAYIGISQITNWQESDLRAYNWALDKAKKEQNIEATKELEALAPYNSNDFDKKGILLEHLSRFGGGVLHDTTQMFDLFMKPLLNVREYSVGEKLSYFPTLVESTQMLLPEALLIDLSKKLPSMKIPVYLVHGKYDQQVSYSLTREYYDSLKAPKKKFFTFEHSAHGLIMEEPEKYKETIVNILLENK